jgi:hypothetical protein
MLRVGMDVCKVPETDIGSDFNQSVKATQGSVERLLKLSLEQNSHGNSVADRQQNQQRTEIFGQRTRQRLLRRDFTSLTMPRRRLRIIARRLKPIYSDNARFLDLLHGLNGLDGYACIPDRTRRAVACRIGG